MIYLLFIAFVLIVTAASYEITYFRKNTKDDLKLGEYNTSKRREKIFKKVQNEGNTKKSN